MNNNSKHQAKTFISSENLMLEFDENHAIRIPIKSIKLIAEFTTPHGPMVDDWYLAIYYQESEYFEMSMYVDNMVEMLKDLGKHLNIDLNTSLANSTDWKSNILFPNESRGMELWKPTIAKPTTIFDRLKNYIGLTKTELELTSHAKDIIGN